MGCQSDQWDGQRLPIKDQRRISTIRSYVADVTRFGGDKPYKNDEGRRFNLKHHTAFEVLAVRTDGVGNIVEMPLLLDKPCFARPERYIRGSHDEAIAPFTGRNNTDGWRLTRCQRCPVEEACSEVVRERIESCPTVSAAFEAWDDGTVGLSGDKPFEGRTGRLWNAFLRAIVKHGGWKSTNDAAVTDAKFAAALKLKAKKSADRKQRRAEASAKRKGISRSATPEFMAEVEAERIRRLGILLDLRGKPFAKAHLPIVSRLSPEGCRRTTDVWVVRAILSRYGRPLTGKIVAQYLKDHLGYTVDLTSLTTWTYKDVERIAKLEGDIAGVTIWSRFDPKH